MQIWMRKMMKREANKVKGEKKVAAKKTEKKIFKVGWSRAWKETGWAVVEATDGIQAEQRVWDSVNRDQLAPDDQEAQERLNPVGELVGEMKRNSMRDSVSYTQVSSTKGMDLTDWSGPSKSRLVEEVTTQIAMDIRVGDVTAIEILLRAVPTSYLRAYLPEKEEDHATVKLTRKRVKRDGGYFE
jgi:hypothetical protein